MTERITRTTLAALATILLSEPFTLAMMCNCHRAYDPTMRQPRGRQLGWFPVFSRVREDLLFVKGDRIEISAFAYHRTIKGTWNLCLNNVKEPFLRDQACEVRPDHSLRMVVPEEKLTPGFYDIYFTVHATSAPKYTGRVTFGYCIDEMPVVDSCPKDLAKFWKKAVKGLNKVPLNATRTFVREMTNEEIDAYNLAEASIPDRYDPKGVKHDKVKVYKLQFDSAYDNAEGRRPYYGWLAVPDGEGPFPGLLVLPGFGNSSLPIPAEHARHGYASLMLQIHGLDIDLPRDEYKYPRDAGYGKKGSRSDKLDDDYYYYVYLACAQAVRCLAAQPDIDGKRLGVCGGSQGAHLATVTAAIAPEIGAAASVLCHWAYWPWRSRVEALNAAKAHGLDQPVPAFDRGKALDNHMSYYDPVNFATIIKAPFLMGLCLNDTPSPATSVHAVYRNLAAKQKELHVSVGTDHDLMFSVETAGFRWMDKHLGTGR